MNDVYQGSAPEVPARWDASGACRDRNETDLSPAAGFPGLQQAQGY